MEKSHPCAGKRAEHCLINLRMTFVKKIEGFTKSKQDYSVDDAKCEHVTSYHRVDHGHERSSEFDGPRGIFDTLNINIKYSNYQMIR